VLNRFADDCPLCHRTITAFTRTGLDEAFKKHLLGCWEKLGKDLERAKGHVQLDLFGGKS